MGWLLLLAALLPLLLAAEPAAAENDMQYLVCSARNKENTAAWISGVVSIKSDDASDAEKAWREMTSAKYAAFASSTGCMRFPTSGAADAKRGTIVDGMRDDGLKTSDVAWSYVAAAKPAAPAATAMTPEQSAQAEVPQ